MKKSKKFYNEYINSDIWREKRERIFIERNNCCEKCGSNKNLQLHHWTYRRLWEELDKDLFVLCGWCHKRFHNIFWMRKLYKSTIDFIKNNNEEKTKTIRISRTEANKFIPSNEFIEYIVNWWKYKWNIFTSSLRIFNSVVRRYRTTI